MTRQQYQYRGSLNRKIKRRLKPVLSDELGAGAVPERDDNHRLNSHNHQTTQQQPCLCQFFWNLDNSRHFLIILFLFSFIRYLFQPRL